MIGLIVMVFPQVVTSANITVAMAREDTRTVAGRAILTLVPPGASIAVTEEPWQFEMPPLDPLRNKIVICGYDAQKLEAASPKAFVYSDLQSDPEVNPHPEFPGELAFWRQMDEAERAGGWRVLFQSSRHLTGRKFWSALWLWRAPPEDMRYVSPMIRVIGPGAAPSP